MWMRCCVLSLLLCGSPVAAGMHKCVDADGNVTYSQTACEEPAGGAPRGGADPAAERAASRSAADFGAQVGPSGAGDALCERVRHFALEIAWAMRHGVGVDRVVAILARRADRGSFARGGGRGTVGNDALEIINQVFALGMQGVAKPEPIADAIARQCVQGHIDFDRGARGGADGLRRVAGSGILLNAQGRVLSQDRLVADCGRLHVNRGGAWHEARLLRRDPAQDLVILLAHGLSGRPAVLTLGDEPTAQPLLAASLPLRGVLMGAVSVAEAEVGMPRTVASPVALSGDAAEVGSMDAQAPLPLALSPGPAQAGSPLLSSAGLVAGMVLSSAEDGAEAQIMPAAALRRFLNSADIAYYSADGLGKLTRQELVRRAAGFTVHVECLP